MTALYLLLSSTHPPFCSPSVLSVSARKLHTHTPAPVVWLGGLLGDKYDVGNFGVSRRDVCMEEEATCLWWERLRVQELDGLHFPTRTSF